MASINCDFSPVKEQLKENLKQISLEIEHSLQALEHEDYCLLSEFEKIKEQFIAIESTASSFYLNCYLSPFTNKYLDLSVSIQHLSERRHGALIVIERNDPLDSLIHPGIPIGATLTYSLLESIFFPGSPLHDGAVLIRKDHIVSGAHVLPHSNVITGEKKLGTRHRAALGLTEKSDALVIVVSEETGNQSFALNGKLHPINTTKPL